MNDNQPMARRVRDDQLDYDEGLVYLFDGVRFSGIGYEEVPGKGLSEISYKDGLQDGLARDWYPSGQIKGESQYKENYLHGHVREFREGGSLISDKIYEYGILVESTEFDEARQKTSHFVLTEDAPNFARLKDLRARFGW